MSKTDKNYHLHCFVGTTCNFNLSQAVPEMAKQGITLSEGRLSSMFGNGGYLHPNGNYFAYCTLYTAEGTTFYGMSDTVACGLIDATTVDTPVSPSAAQKKLENTPISPSEVDKIVKGNDAIAKASDNPSIEIEGEQPTINDGDYTSKSDSPSQTNTNPAGEIAKKKERIDCVKSSSTTLDCQKTTDTEVTKPDGSVTHDVTAEAPTMEEMGLEKATPENKPPAGFDCKATPDLIMCSKWGTAPTAEKLPVKEVPITIDNKSLGAGTCPAPKVINLSGGHTMSLSYQPECDFATKIKPIILAFVWLTAGFIVVGGVKELSITHKYYSNLTS